MPFTLSDFSPAPSTPDRRNASSSYGYDSDEEHPTTTPAGPPPPSSAPSYTPAGDPSPSYLNSSIGAMTGKVKPLNFKKASSKPSLGKGAKVPLGSSIRGSTTRQPSRLSRQYYADDDDDDEEEEDYGDDEDEQELPTKPSGTYGVPMNDNARELGDAETEDEEDEEDEEEMEDMMEDDVEQDIEEDLLREIAETAGMDPDPYLHQFDDSDSDIMMMATPGVDERIRRDAEHMLRMSSRPKKKGFKYAPIAKDVCSHHNLAEVSEPDSILLQTEDIINRLYDEGVGTKDDREKLAHTLSQACIKLIDDVWGPYVESLSRRFEEHAAKVGPPPDAPNFEKAKYLAALILRIHHTPPVRNEFGGSRYPALPSILFNWQDTHHNLDGDQISLILRHRPSPASHSLFWQGAFSSLVRGNVETAVELLRGAGWESIKKSARGEPLYKGQALENIRLAVEDLSQVIEICPAISNDSWDIRSSDWTLFRLKAKAAKENLIDFAEGKDRHHLAVSRFGEPAFADSIDSRRSLTGLARKAESQIPWDIYESLQSLYAILIGEADAILAASQDWCEATIGLLGWWNEEESRRSMNKSQPRPATEYTESSADEYFLDRLASCFYQATHAEFHFDSTDMVELAIACVFEDNIEDVIQILRTWSLPVASAIAEIGALGGWLLPPESNLISMSSLDMEDLELLGVDQNASPDEKDGIKDATLIHYARGLRNRKIISGTISKGKVSREGWEIAVQVVGRIDSADRSEEMVRDLLQSVLSTINEDSHETVDKVWRLLNELGMINFAEDTAEAFGDVLAGETFRFGETLWYYALAHRPGKVRDVLNTLMSISLVESTTYPPKGELDNYLKRLLTERATTLEQFAKQDLEAAELLGKMLSGYATLRRFYELRDGDGKTNTHSLARRQQAASALMAVIASADDNIRGGLYDDTRDAVVSEDFLLALLGEASVFVNQSPPVITLEQIDILLKAVEDIQTVGSRVYEAADEFFKLILASGHGLKGSSPADLLKRSTGNLGGSFVMTGSSMMASQLHQSVVKSGMIKGPIKRAWDWRTSVLSGSSSGDVLKRIRLGLTKDLANLWLEQADSVIL
ncbi:hypothetical protein DL764_008776 [Monosporascus ibericus]|uniref:Uncharacterized protein n=1 Tax=Monosporascus ibericus TaxID=155417 RepID=A0A4Q4SWM0_9PEZI|nr:hypothetical protein DL764_008776 [Monosporascus ibericus]